MRIIIKIHDLTGTAIDLSSLLIIELPFDTVQYATDGLLILIGGSDIVFARNPSNHCFDNCEYVRKHGQES